MRFFFDTVTSDADDITTTSFLSGAFFSFQLTESKKLPLPSRLLHIDALQTSPADGDTKMQNCKQSRENDQKFAMVSFFFLLALLSLN